MEQILARLPYAYHMTDLPNFIQCLKYGALLSRAQLASLNRKYGSAAKPEVLARRTHRTIIDDGREYAVSLEHYVPLYFRTRTPMQYRTEGIKVVPDDFPHVPRPVLIQFRVADLITEDSLVADGNASDDETVVVKGADGISRLRPTTILGEGSWYNEEIKRVRQAELLIPCSLSLGKASAVFFRTPAELRAAEESAWDQGALDYFRQASVKPDLFYHDHLRVENYGFSHREPPKNFDRMLDLIRSTKRTDTYSAGEPLWYGMHVYRPSGVTSKLVLTFTSESGDVLETGRWALSDDDPNNVVCHGSFEPNQSCWATCTLAGHEMFREYLDVDDD